MGNSLQQPKHFEGLADPKFKSAWDLYCDGLTYKEIAEALDSDLFQVMSDVAREATIHAAQTRDNPQIDIAFANAQLKRVIAKAWDDHGVATNEEGSTFNGLPIVVAASRELVKNAKLLAGKKFAGEEQSEQIVPAGIKKSELRKLGRETVRSRFFPQMQAVEGGVK